MIPHFCLEKLLGVPQIPMQSTLKAAQMCKQSSMTGALKHQVQFLHAQVLLVSLHAASNVLCLHLRYTCCSQLPLVAQAGSLKHT